MDTTNSHQTESSSLLKLEDVIRFKVELNDAVRLYQTLPDKIARLEKRLEAALMFLPEGTNLDLLATAPGPKQDDAKPDPSKPGFHLAPPEQRRLTWIGETERVLKAVGRGMEHQELLVELNKTELSERPSEGDKGFYNAIARLAEKGDLIKFGGYLYAGDVYKQLVDAGVKLPINPDKVRAGSSASLVLDAIDAHPEGISGPDLKRALAKLEDAPSSFREHTQYVYNVVGTLIGKGIVVKDGDLYKRAKK